MKPFKRKQQRPSAKDVHVDDVTKKLDEEYQNLRGTVSRLGQILKQMREEDRVSDSIIHPKK